jgi:hypothetical protein
LTENRRKVSVATSSAFWTNCITAVQDPGRIQPAGVTGTLPRWFTVEQPLTRIFYLRFNAQVRID